MKVSARLVKALKAMSMLAVGGTMFQGACLPDDFWAGVLSSTIIDGTIALVRDAVVGAALGG